ncbi:Chemotaxis protein PomA [Hartmannibacter diazotrophicus]|uniref:Chemotaxis protein PomA n=1 Tax=Hartmannibacter diazotrophicus TaxID=1482074 RepID=A0A2C9DBA9_9HYPH|nr:MotA/TolQ/ExbB proton channel family protein [Hartmannibacter diazotrophicus]SON57622.1 Chemotaxis protein PomA [Hartmannibacter diazotrophicus]
MDIATIIGIIGAFAVTAWAIWMGGAFSAFVDVPSIGIVVGGSIFVVMLRFQLNTVIGALATGGKAAFQTSKASPRDLIENITEMAEVVRKQGPLGLESLEIADPFLSKGKQMIADGYDPSFIQESMERERDLYLTRLAEGARIFKAMGDSAPAFGMIGTLVGLVQMLQAMDDPSKIGPAMAVALLTTLYGALIANVICLPVHEKLNAKVDVEEINQTLIIDGVVQIRNSKSPNLIREMLLAYLPEKQRQAEEAEAA